MGIKINKNYEQSISDCTLVRQTEVTPTDSGDAPESVISWLAYSHLDTSIQPSIPDYLRYLDAKLSAVRKTATSWDAYNIYDSANSTEDFIQKYGVLPNNSSLIIATNNININNKVYNNGDIVMKNHVGEEVHIINNASGVYKPTEIKKASEDSNETNYTLTFEFTSENDSNTTDVTVQGIETPNEGTLYSQIIYSKNITDNSISINLKSDTENNKILPFWECREYNDSDNKIGDKIFDIIEATINSDNSTLTLTPKTKDVPFVLIIK